MILCVYCGNEMEEEARVCPSCGKEVELPENAQAVEPEAEDPAQDMNDAGSTCEIEEEKASEPAMQEDTQGSETTEQEALAAVPANEDDKPDDSQTETALETEGTAALEEKKEAEPAASTEAVEAEETPAPDDGSKETDAAAEPSGGSETKETAEETATPETPGEADAKEGETLKTDAAGEEEAALDIGLEETEEGESLFEDEDSSDIEAASDMAIHLDAPVLEKEPAQEGERLSLARAVSALVCGIAGLATCMIPIVGLVLSIVAMVLGAKARSHSVSQRRGMAIAGFILGVIGLVISIGALIWWIVILTSGAKVFWLLGSLV